MVRVVLRWVKSTISETSLPCMVYEYYNSKTVVVHNQIIKSEYMLDTSILYESLSIRFCIPVPHHGPRLGEPWRSSYWRHHLWWASSPWSVWNHGVFVGIAMMSESTAADEHAGMWRDKGTNVLYWRQPRGGGSVKSWQRLIFVICY